MARICYVERCALPPCLTQARPVVSASGPAQRVFCDVTARLLPILRCVVCVHVERLPRIRRGRWDVHA
jgi:hypothetical protein